MLGRFIQPDTIVPVAAQGVLAFDRYAYANNSPVRWIDPTGHSVDCAIGETDCQAGKRVKRIQTTDIPLREFGKDNCKFCGTDAYKIYLYYWNTPGWWNSDGDFSLVDFLGLWILTEANWPPVKKVWPADEIAGYISQIVSQNLYAGGPNAPVCSLGKSCWNGVFNYMAATSQGADSLFSGPDIPGGYFGPGKEGMGDPSGLMKAAAKYGRKAFLANLNSLNLDVRNAISLWGNDMTYANRLRSKGLVDGHLYGPNDPQYYYGAYVISNWYMYSTNQSSH